MENGRIQKTGIDCDEPFIPIVKPATMRTVLSLAISHQWSVHQLDVKNAFPQGRLHETFYMHLLVGFCDPFAPHHVFLLNKSLYGIKQAPREWYHQFS